MIVAFFQYPWSFLGAEVFWEHLWDGQQEICVSNDKLPQPSILQLLWNWRGKGGY